MVVKTNIRRQIFLYKITDISNFQVKRLPYSADENRHDKERSGTCCV